jgi:hypothetical protein
MPSSPLGSPSVSGLLSLPTELIERIIVYTLTAGSQKNIANIALTCSVLHTVVYGPSCGYLWRAIFFSIFDDPGDVSRCLSLMGISSKIGTNKEFDWARALKSRVAAALNFKALTRLPDHPNLQPTSSSDPVDSGSTTPNSSPPPQQQQQHQSSLGLLYELPGALESIMSTIDTERPYPKVPMIAFSSPAAIESLSGTPFPAYPAFPPLMLLFATMRIGNPYPEILESMNTNWLHDVFRTGYPPALVHRILLGTTPIDHPIFQDWPSSPLAKTFFRMMTHTGFIPMPYLAPESDSGAGGGAGEGLRLGAVPIRERDEGRRSFPHMPPDEQRERVRRWARTTVYNLRYLWSERQWGPFLAITEDTSPIAQGRVFFAQRTTQAATTATATAGAGDDGDGDEDGEASSSNDEWADDDLVPLIINTHPRPAAAATSSSTAVSNLQLKPDWMFLAAVRILVEMNLKDSLGSRTDGGDIDLVIEGLSEALQRLDGGRVGGAPGYWHGQEGYQQVLEEARRREEERKQPMSSKGKGKEKEEEDEDEEKDKVEGWDWAGVEGQWK